ncbi:hypothetical protein SAMN04488128_103164 [Chitinophaga eiseniae]|uniref:Gp49 pectin lyase-like domain-containing protein n=1 Tax=Chitinophaga eiseniae TaxID=634771 RepID=A0A1T4SNH5_9BACT|nr:hypothetical protein [Chitinophaga eiseniae]SKA29723.1 hypothetical protein SAMN04488128_103164 [Chitinophaga eiseniae]
MKRIVNVIIVLLLACTASAQTYQNRPEYGWRFKNIIVDSTLNLPRDTVMRSNLAVPGAIVYQLSDSSLYTWNGSWWNKIVSASQITALDSARRSNDTLYFRLTSGGELAIKMTGIPQANINALPDSLLNKPTYGAADLRYIRNQITAPQAGPGFNINGQAIITRPTYGFGDYLTFVAGMTGTDTSYIGPTTSATGGLGFKMNRAADFRFYDLSSTIFQIKRDTVTNITGVFSMQNAAGNHVLFGTPGQFKPTYSGRSPGSRLVFYPHMGTNSVDKAIGVDSTELWASVDSVGTKYSFGWYAGTQKLANLRGDSLLTAYKLQLYNANTGAGRAIVGDAAGNMDWGKIGEVDTVQALNSFYSYTGRANLLYWIDTTRGGLFYRIAGPAVADTGVIIPGAAGGYWKRIYDKHTVKVDWWGPARDGITDDLRIIQKALDFGATNVVLGNGSYAISYQVNLRDGVNLSGQGIDKTIIVALPSTANPPPVGPPDTWALYGEGTVTQLPNLTSVAKTQDTSIALVSSTSLNANDLIMIGDTASYSYSSYRYFYKQGEYFFTTKSSTGSTAYVQGGLFGNYPTASTSVYKVTPIKGSISNLTVDSRNYTIGIGIKHGLGYNVYNVKSINGNRGNINYYFCINSGIRDCYASMNQQSINPYGLLIANSQNITIERNYAYATRHGISVGSMASYPLVNRGIRVINNTFADSTNSGGNGAVDFHGNVEGSVIANNTVYGSISAGGGNNMISGNTIYLGNHSNRAIFLYEVRDANYDIKDNNVTFSSGTYDLLGSGFNFSGAGGEAIGGTLRITGNRFTYLNSATATNTIYTYYNLATANINVYISGNTIVHQPNTLANMGAAALGLNGTSRFNTITITNNVFKYAGIRADYSRNVQIRSNTLDSSNTYAVLSSNNGSVDISSNHAEGYGYAGTANTGFLVSNTGRVWFNNNYGGSNAASHAYRAVFSSDTSLQIGVNNLYGSTNSAYSISGSTTAQNNIFPSGYLGVGVNPASTLQSGGSFGATTSSISTSTTLGEVTTVFITASGITVTLPAAATYPNRIYKIRNTTAGSCTISSVSIDGSGTTTFPANTTWEVQSDGAGWKLLSRSN